MWKRIATVIGVLILAFGVLAAVVMGAMRAKCPPVLRTVRRFNRAVTNPNAMKTAGQPGAYAAVIHHVGRASGDRYHTPVGPFPTEDGFVIALPYGTTPDWLKNVLVAGSATLTSEGRTYFIDEPEVVGSSEAMSAVPAKDQRSLRWFKVTDFLRVRGVEMEDEPN